MKKALVLFAVSCLSIGLIGCGGGGGGGGSSSSSTTTTTPPPPTPLTVTAISPSNGSKIVDPRNVTIVATFSANVQATAFVNSKAMVGRLLAAKGFVANEAGTNNSADLSSLSLSQIVSGKYVLHQKFGSSEYPAIITGYQFHWDGTGTSLTVNMLSGQTVYFSKTELKSTNVGQQSSLTLTNDLTKAPIPGDVTVTANQVTFHALQTLDWQTKYDVTIAAGVKSADGTETLSAAFNSNFTTIAMPTPAIQNVSPVGIQADPIEPIVITPNFVVTSTNLSSLVTLNQMSLDSTGKQVLTPVTANVTWDATNNNIVVTPSSDLAYTTEYQVVVTGGTNGLLGTLGNSTVNLTNNYTWTFTTDKPNVYMTSPTVTDPKAANVSLTPTITLKFDFRPDPTTVNSSNITLMSGTTGVACTITQVDAATFTVTPTSPLDNATQYTLTVSPSVLSKDNPSIHLASTQSFSFTTVNRLLLTETPQPNTHGATNAQPIVLTFNFNVMNGTWTNPSNFSIGTSSSQSGPFTPVTLQGTFSYVSNGNTNPGGTLTWTPSSTLPDNEWVQVTIGNGFQSADGNTIYNPTQWTFQVMNHDLEVASTSPTPGQNHVMVNSTIQFTFNYNIDPTTVSQSSIVLDASPNCPTLPTGTVSVSGSSVYYTPIGALDSFCNYTATISKDIKGTSGQQQTTAAAPLNFTTDGLAITNTLISTNYENYADVGTNIEVDFNYNLACCVTNSAIQVTDDSGYPVYGVVYESGNSLTFVPNNNLNYGTGYNVILDASQVVGVDGETLPTSYQTSFMTENLPLNVVDYGPTGTVDVASQFWVQLDQFVDTQGFPSYTADVSGYATILSASGETVYATPASTLNYSTSYTVTFNFNYNYGLDDFSHWWDVTTISGGTTSSGTGGTTSSGTSGTTTGGGGTTSPGTTGVMAPTTVHAQLRRDLSKSCRNNSNCVGSLKVTNNAQLTAYLAALKKISIMKNVGVSAKTLKANMLAAHGLH